MSGNNKFPLNKKNLGVGKNFMITKKAINNILKINGGILKRNKAEYVEEIQTCLERPAMHGIITTLLWTLGHNWHDTTIILEELKIAKKEGL